MSQRTMLLVAVLTALALFAMPVAPAGALTDVSVAFLGKWTVAGPLGIPGSGVGKGVTHTWSFSSGAGNLPPGGLCLGAIVSRKFSNVLADAGACSISASGILGPGILGLGPWCDHQIGSGTGSMYTETKQISFSVGWVSAGNSLAMGATVFPMTGTASKGGQSGPIVILIKAFNDVTKPAQSSCLNGTATTFLIAGVAQAVLTGTK